MKRIACILLCSLFSLAVMGKTTLKSTQKQFLRGYGYGEGGFDPDRLLLGGNLGMNFYDKGYSAFFSPTIGYGFGRFVLGLSAGYYFTHQKIDYLNGINNLPEVYPYSASDYNVSLFTRLGVLGPLFVQAEPGFGFYKSLDSMSYEMTTGKAVEHAHRGSVPFILVGGGFMFPIGDRVSFVIYGLYDVLQNQMSPYRGLPVIRGGFNVGNLSN